MVGQVAGLGEEILERRPFDFFHFSRAAVARIQILLEERAEINLFERVFLFDGRDRVLFGGSGMFAFFFTAANVVDQRDAIFQFFQNRIFHHLGVDHVLELKFVERKHADHLHEAWGQDLSLRDLQAQSVLQQDHGRLNYLSYLDKTNVTSVIALFGELLVTSS